MVGQLPARQLHAHVTANVKGVGLPPGAVWRVGRKSGFDDFKRPVTTAGEPIGNQLGVVCACDPDVILARG